MNDKTILKFSRRELFNFFISTLDLLYEKREVDVNSVQFEFETFFKDATYIDPLPRNGDSVFYSGQYTSLWFDSKRDITAAIQVINDEPIFKEFSKNPSIKLAFDIYSKLPIPKGEGKERVVNQAFIDRLKHSGQSYLIDGYLDQIKVIDFQKMDFYRFSGYVAINYAFYLFDLENLEAMRREQKTPAQVRDALIGVKPKSNAKNQSRNGPLLKMIDLVESGYGLVDSSQNTELLNLLKKLGLQAVSLELGQTTPNPLFDKRFHVPTKRFVQRMGSRLCSEYRYEEEKGSLVELLIYHLLHAQDLKGGVTAPQDADLRKQVTRDIQPFYEHRSALHRSWSSDHMPLDDVFQK